MVTGWEMLPETAKAISAPLTKLIEVVAAGCGRLHEPSNIRRTAAAQGDALVLMEEAKARASDIALRAAQRAIDVEVRRQANIEAIVAKAQRQLPAVVSESPVDPDWVSRVIQTCQDISDEEMQSLWARTLAGEVAQPGSFSLRTVHVLAQLSKPEALAFEALCTQALQVKGTRYPMVFTNELAEVKSIGLGSSDFLRILEEAGLISKGELGYSVGHAPGGHVAFVAGDSREIHVSNHKTDDGIGSLDLQFYSTNKVPVGYYLFTGAGRELANLVENVPSAFRVESIVKLWEKEQLMVQRYQRHADDNGMTVLKPVEQFSEAEK